jgi:hypothetical protein
MAYRLLCFHSVTIKTNRKEQAMKSVLITVTAGLLILLLSELAVSQPAFLAGNIQKHFGIRLSIPNFKESDEASVRIMTFMLNTATSGKAGFVMEIPYVHYETSDYYWSPYSSRSFQDDAIGNPYLGYQSFLRGDHTITEIGTRIPIASSKKSMSLAQGFYSDFDNIEAYTSNCWSIQAALDYCPKNQTGLSAILRISPSLLIPTGEGGTLEIFIHYSGQVWYNSGALDLGAGILGFASLTESGLAAEHGVFAHQLLLAANYKMGKFIPGIRWKIPLDGNAREFLSSMVSLNVFVIF